MSQSFEINLSKSVDNILEGEVMPLQVEECPTCDTECPDCIIATLAKKSANSPEFFKRLEERKRTLKILDFEVLKTSESQDAEI